jgi:hypothetical protein
MWFYDYDVPFSCPPGREAEEPPDKVGKEFQTIRGG